MTETETIDRMVYDSKQVARDKSPEGWDVRLISPAGPHQYAVVWRDGEFDGWHVEDTTDSLTDAWKTYNDMTSLP